MGRRHLISSAHQSRTRQPVYFLTETCFPVRCVVEEHVLGGHKSSLQAQYLHIVTAYKLLQSLRRCLLPSGRMWVVYLFSLASAVIHRSLPTLLALPFCYMVKIEKAENHFLASSTHCFPRSCADGQVKIPAWGGSRKVLWTHSHAELPLGEQRRSMRSLGSTLILLGHPPGGRLRRRMACITCSFYARTATVTANAALAVASGAPASPRARLRHQLRPWPLPLRRDARRPSAATRGTRAHRRLGGQTAIAARHPVAGRHAGQVAWRGPCTGLARRGEGELEQSGRDPGGKGSPIFSECDPHYRPSA